MKAEILPRDCEWKDTKMLLKGLDKAKVSRGKRKAGKAREGQKKTLGMVGNAKERSTNVKRRQNASKGKAKGRPMEGQRKAKGRERKANEKPAVSQ